MTIRNLELQGPAGRIEAFLKAPAGGEPAAAAVMCHPHPLFGGTMHNKVVFTTASTLAGAGLPVLRFNFRGVGLSQGVHDAGRGEQTDLGVVLDHMAGLYPGLPLILAGYSFGAWVGLRVGCLDDRVAALIGIGVPVSLFDFVFLSRCTKPLSIIQGSEDQFGPMSALLPLMSSLPGGAKVRPVSGASHGFAGHLETLSRRVSESIPAEMITRRPAGGA